MSRSEMMKQLPTPSELRESAQSMEKSLSEALRQLDQIKTEMASLPQAVATELATVTRLAETMDQSLRAQRSTLNVLVGEIRAQALDTTTKMIETSQDIQAATKALRSARNIPDQVRESVGQIKKIQRGQIWKITLLMVASSLLSSVLVLLGAGMLDSSRPVQPSGQPQTEQGDVWQKLKSLPPSK